MAEQNAARTANRPQKYPTAQEIDKMVNDRQRVSDDLSRLTQQMRDAARELAPTQPARFRQSCGARWMAWTKTISARACNAVRINCAAASSPIQSETALTSDLQKLGQQVGDAARALGSAQHASEDAALNRAMDDLSRLRDQLAGLGGQPGRPGQQPNGPTRWPTISKRSIEPQWTIRSVRSTRSTARPAAGAKWSSRRRPARLQGGPVGNRLAGPVGNPGGGATNGGRNANGGYDMGNTRISGRAVAPQQGPNPADTQREIDQGLNLLNGVRAVVQDSPEARRELQALIDQMRNLDPSRFPGNPGLVEQMHQQLVSGVDALELQLRRQLEEKQGGTIRNTDPSKIPAGYQESVAEYYRKLSSSSH